MKGIFKIGLKVLKIADKALIGGAVTNVLESTETHPKGSLDTVKLIKTIGTITVPVILVLMFAFGKITIEEVKQLFSILD